MQEAVKRVQEGNLSFEIERVGVFNFAPSTGTKNSSVTSAYADAGTELRRILRSHLTEAVVQLHKEHPGIVIIQSNGELDESLSRVIVTGMFAGMGVDSEHVSAVVFLPVTYWMPIPWAMFNPFIVYNPHARASMDTLDISKILFRHLLERKIAVPGD